MVDASPARAQRDVSFVVFGNPGAAESLTGLACASARRRSAMHGAAHPLMLSVYRRTA
jgi:hypothetical protein